MGTDFNLALQLLLVGMITVGVILALVVGLGSALIRVTNRLFPEPETTKKDLKKRVDVNGSEVSSEKMAAIVAAVNIATGGEGRIVEIEKVK